MSFSLFLSTLKKQCKKCLMLLVFCATFILSGCETLKEIDKGLYSATGSVTQKDRITGLRTLSFHDRQAQIQTGNGYMTTILAEINKNNIKTNENVDPEMYARLQNVFSRVQSISHFRDEKWEVTLVEEDSFNAFVTGGSTIVVFSGLMKKTSDAELAAIIGHEIGHIAANHGFEKQAHKITSLVAQSNSVKRESYGAAFTHENEREADQIGILYCSLAGYDPYAAHKLWTKEFENSGDLWFGVPNDHPVYSQRATEAKATADKVAEYYDEGSINPDFEKLLVRNSLWDANGIELEAGKGGGLLATLEATADALGKHKTAKREEERQKNKNAFVDAVGKCVTFMNLEVLAEDTFRITIHYHGDRAINNITFLAVMDNECQIKSDSGGPVQPNGQYYIIFKDKRLLNYAAPPDFKQIIIVDAR